MRVHLNLVKILICISRKPTMLWRCNLYQLTSFAKLQKTLTNLSIIPHTLSTLTTNITHYIIVLKYINESQVNVQVV